MPLLRKSPKSLKSAAVKNVTEPIPAGVIPKAAMMANPNRNR